MTREGWVLLDLALLDLDFALAVTLVTLLVFSQLPPLT